MIPHPSPFHLKFLQIMSLIKFYFFQKFMITKFDIFDFKLVMETGFLIFLYFLYKSVLKSIVTNYKYSKNKKP